MAELLLAVVEANGQEAAGRRLKEQLVVYKQRFSPLGQQRSILIDEPVGSSVDVNELTDDVRMSAQPP